MKKQIFQSKNFKKSHKFLKAKVNTDGRSAIISKKNLSLNNKQLSAVTQKLIRHFKTQKFDSLTIMNKNLTKKSLGSKLGSGKGKFVAQVSMVRKYQRLLSFHSKEKVSLIQSKLSKFTNFL